jgi:hypothetical protein
LLHNSSLERAEITVRPTERGLLRAEFARCRVLRQWHIRHRMLQT